MRIGTPQDFFSVQVQTSAMDRGGAYINAYHNFFHEDLSCKLPWKTLVCVLLYTVCMVRNTIVNLYIKNFLCGGVFEVDIKAYMGSASEWSGDALAVFVSEEDLGDFRFLGEDIAGLVSWRVSESSFKAQKDTTLWTCLFDKRVKHVFLVGLGKESQFQLDDFRRAAALAVKQATKERCRDVLMVLARDGLKGAHQAMVEGAVLGNYKFSKYKTKKDNDSEWEIERIYVKGSGEADIKEGIVFAESQNFVRDLVNEPGNVINPVSLAEKAKKIGEEGNLEVYIYDENQLKEMGMLGLLSVGGASKTPPRLIHMIYKPQNPVEKIAFVGKGITFDSGGLNIKPSDFMRTMKGDKAGACNVLGLMRAIAKMDLPFEVHGFIGAAENMPGGGAYRPDDIIRLRNGKTVEIDNTDAEGRVTLADVLSYASEQNPSCIIDMATLTGACAVALGEYTAGVFANDDELVSDFLATAKETGERMWQLPIDDERLRKKIKSPVADVVNSAGRYGGAITAAMFLQEFVGEGIKWLHVDMAGTDNTKEEYGYYIKGATGFGVRTCLAWLREKERKRPAGL
jgi:leucyl aminopeptidase